MDHETVKEIQRLTRLEAMAIMMLVAISKTGGEAAKMAKQGLETIEELE